MAQDVGSTHRPVAAGLSWVASGGLALLALGILIGVISLAPGQHAGAVDAGTALDFTSASSQRVTLARRSAAAAPRLPLLPGWPATPSHHRLR